MVTTKRHILRRAAVLSALAALAFGAVAVTPALVGAAPRQAAQVHEPAPAAAQASERAAVQETATPAASTPRKVRIIKLYDVPPEQQRDRL